MQLQGKSPRAGQAGEDIPGQRLVQADRSGAGPLVDPTAGIGRLGLEKTSNADGHSE